MPQNRFGHKKGIIKKRTQHPKDKKKLAVVAYLVSISPKGATKNKIATKARIRSQEGSEFDNFMNELVIIGWVIRKESESVGGYDNFFVTEKGRDALNKAKELVREGHPLVELEIFQDILDF
jgi:predicted transcriptional regulator